jgi:glycosyltransferase involved in cell wall biosynthesis
VTDRQRSAVSRASSYTAIAQDVARSSARTADPSSSRKKVALVGHEIRDHGGMDRAVTELLCRASDQVEFHVISTELSDALRPLVRWHRLRIPRRPFPLRYVAFYVVAGIRLLWLRVDVIHTLGAIVPNRVDVATVHACHAGFVRATGALAPAGAPTLRRINTAVSRLLSLAAERWTYRPSRVRAVAAVSTGVFQDLQQHYPGVRIEITPNGVDSDRFRPDSVVRRGLRQEEGVDPDQYVALFVGGNWDHKGLPIVIESIAKGRAMGSPIDELWVVGSGDAERLRSFAARQNVADAVKFFGPRADVERFYKAADLFVLPSLYEAFSLVLLEAAASGLPIITTAVHGVDELNTGRGVLVVDRTAEAVAKAISDLRADPKRINRLSQAGRAQALSYTWASSVESILRIYGDLVSESAVIRT